MLKALRDGAKSGFLKYILLGFLALATGGLVLTDMGGFFRGGVVSNNIVAKGKGIEISTVQFDRTVRRVLSRQGIAPQEAYQLGYITQILQGEVQTLILTREASKLGLNVSDDTVLAQIAKIAEPLAQGGTSKKEALQQVLRSQGVSEGEFIQAVRQEMGNDLFRGALISGVETISKEQASDLYQYQNEIRDVRGFTLMDKSAEITQEPTDENIQKYYEANKSDFLISEKRDVTVATLKKEMVIKNVEITEDELKQAYEETIDTYKRPEQRTLQQSIVDLQTDAQDIVKKVKAGKSLKTAVKTVTGNASPYLGENDFEQGGLLEEISTPVFEAEKGAIIGPIQTALGWHALVLKDIIEPQTTSFDKAKAALRDNMLQERVFEDLIEAANTLDDRLASGEELESVVAEMGLTTQKFTNFNQAGIDSKGKDLFGEYQGDRAQILEAAFDFEQGESSPVVELADGRFVTVRIDGVVEKSYQPLEDVKAKLTTRWLAAQKSLANKQRAQDALATLKSGKTLDEVAKEYGAKLTSFKNLKRAQTPKAPITLPALRQIYDAQQGAPLKLDVQNGYVIGEVTNVTLPNVDKADKEIEAVMAETTQVLPQEIIAQYINNLSAKYKVKINDRVLKQVYGAPVEN